MKIKKMVMAFAAGIMTLFTAAVTVLVGMSGTVAVDSVKNCAGQVRPATANGEIVMQSAKNWLVGEAPQFIPAEKNVALWSGAPPGIAPDRLDLQPGMPVTRALCENSGILIKADQASIAKILRAGEHRGSG